MRQAIIFSLVMLSFATWAQAQKWQLSLLVQPEITFHKERYRWNGEGNGKRTFNIGVTSLAQYNIDENFFLNGGVGFISRKLRINADFNKYVLPPPRQGFTDEGVSTVSVSYRVLSFPVNIGYNFLRAGDFKAFATTGFSGNYLLNANYYCRSKYDGVYSKRYWQGWALNVGLGTDYKLSKTLVTSASLTYALVNKVKEDEYIHGETMGGLALAHNYINLNLGVKFSF